MDSNNLKISVIVPVYNVEQYLSRCIDSILAQTFTNFELLLIDDGSTDGSGKICDEYSVKDSRIRVFHKENGGVSSARNLGLRKFTGDYVVFADSDDMVTSQWLETYSLNIDKYKCDICFQGYVSVPNDCCGNNIQNKDINCVEGTLVDDNAFFNFFKNNWVSFSATWSKCFSAAVIRENDIEFKLEYNLYEDFLFTTRFLSYSKKVAIASSAGYLYRRTPSGLSQKNKNEFNIISDLLTTEFDRLEDRNGYVLSCKIFLVVRLISSSIYPVLSLTCRYKMLSFIKANKIYLPWKKLRIVNLLRKLGVGERIWDKYIVAVNKINCIH